MDLSIRANGTDISCRFDHFINSMLFFISVLDHENLLDPNIDFWGSATFHFKTPLSNVLVDKTPLFFYHSNIQDYTDICQHSIPQSIKNPQTYCYVRGLAKSPVRITLFQNKGRMTTRITMVISIVVNVNGCSAFAKFHFLMANSAQMHDAVQMDQAIRSSVEGCR